jgi:hypothetical protein
MKVRCIRDAVAAGLILEGIASHAGGATARRGSVLEWDQADSVDCLGQIELVAGNAVAVGFVAPSWARSVTKVGVFFTSCCFMDVGPPPPEIKEFEARVSS